MVTHASHPDDQMTYCGLPVRLDTNTTWLHEAIPEHIVWYLVVDCPQCLDSPEVKARIVEHALDRGGSGW